eukprot:5200840-Prymnesium_polylepis.1
MAVTIIASAMVRALAFVRALTSGSPTSRARTSAGQLVAAVIETAMTSSMPLRPKKSPALPPLTA